MQLRNKNVTQLTFHTNTTVVAPNKYPEIAAPMLFISQIQ